MDLIWAKREAIYFCGHGWTGSISLIGNDKFAVWCRGSALNEPVDDAGRATIMRDLSTSRNVGSNGLVLRFEPMPSASLFCKDDTERSRFALSVDMHLLQIEREPYLRFAISVR
jgi:hypothetical protein